MEKVIITADRMIQTRNLIILLVLAALSYSWNYEYMQQTGTETLAAYAGTVFFLLAFIILCIFTISGYPALHLSKEGILDKSDIAKPGLISWEDIDDISVEMPAKKKISYRDRNVVLKLKDENKYLDNLPAWKKCLLKLNYRKYSSLTTIYAKNLSYPTDDLHELIKSYRSELRQQRA